MTVLSSNGALSLDLSLLTFARAMATRDLATFEHAKRVRRHATALAANLGIADPDSLRTIETAALLHDIGKLAIPDRLLGKRGPLTSEEYAHVKQHTTIGADLLEGLSFPGLASLVRHHHENWDGTGYPARLRGDDIPAGARVLAIADCYDALTSDRPYRRALTHANAMAMVADRSGSMFDPHMTDAFLQLLQDPLPVSDHGWPLTQVRQAYGLSPVEAGAR